MIYYGLYIRNHGLFLQKGQKIINYLPNLIFLSPLPSPQVLFAPPHPPGEALPHHPSTGSRHWTQDFGSDFLLLAGVTHVCVCMYVADRLYVCVCMCVCVYVADTDYRPACRDHSTRPTLTETTSTSSIGSLWFVTFLFIFFCISLVVCVCVFVHVCVRVCS